MAIDDKLGQLYKYASTGLGIGANVNYIISTEGKVIENPDEVSFLKIFAKNNQIFSLTFPTEKIAEPKKWMRFKEWTTTDYFYMSKNYPDAVIFRPKKDITFYGVGVFSNFRQMDIKVKFWWALGTDGADFKSE